MLLGNLFALADAEDQAKMINDAGRQWASWKDKLDMQAAMLTRHLDHHGQDLILKLADFVKLDRGEKL